MHAKQNSTKSKLISLEMPTRPYSVSVPLLLCNPHILDCTLTLILDLIYNALVSYLSTHCCSRRLDEEVGEQAGKTSKGSATSHVRSSTGGLGRSRARSRGARHCAVLSELTTLTCGRGGRHVVLCERRGVLVCGQCVGARLGRVDDTDHTSLAMLALGAVEPNGCGGVLDFVGECPVCDGVHGGGGDEARPETVVHWRAGRGESALGNGVVLGPEAESDHVTLSSCDGFGNEDETAGLVGHGDEVLLCNSGANHGGSSED
jgi:hypothetical protein